MISRALLLLLAKQSSNIPEPFKKSLELFNDRFFLDLAVSATAAEVSYCGKDLVYVRSSC